MASRILGFLLGLLFIGLGVLPFITPMFNFDFLDTIENLYSIYAIGPVSIFSIVFVLIGLFCLQSAIRDTWPFYG